LLVVCKAASKGFSFLMQHQSFPHSGPSVFSSRYGDLAPLLYLQKRTLRGVRQNRRAPFLTFHTSFSEIIPSIRPAEYE
jgi:hypothetical protein